MCVYIYIPLFSQRDTTTSSTRNYPPPRHPCLMARCIVRGHLSAWIKKKKKGGQGEGKVEIIRERIRDGRTRERGGSLSVCLSVCSFPLLDQSRRRHRLFAPPRALVGFLRSERYLSGIIIKGRWLSRFIRGMLFEGWGISRGNWIINVVTGCRWCRFLSFWIHQFCVY